MSKTPLTINEMLAASIRQHEFYKGKWKPLTKENAVDKSLWLVGELGEVIDIIKKKNDKITQDDKVRSEFVKEMVDCYMYMADMLNCYGITAEELSTTFREKLEYNLNNSRTYWKDKKYETGCGWDYLK